MSVLRVAGAQLDLTVGDLSGNRDRILDAMTWAEEVEADVMVLPELAVSGYPPEDLVLKPAFLDDNRRVVEELAARSGAVVTLVGFVDRAEDHHPSRLDDAVGRWAANAVAVLHDGELRGVYHKVLLPNYGVFDEDRYFVPGRRPVSLWGVGGATIGVSICEDLWVPGEGPPIEQAEAGAQVVFNLNASPYHRGRREERTRLLAAQARTGGVPIVYLNLVGAQDELVFDGDSVVVSQDGEVLFRAAQFAEQRFWLDLPLPERPRSDHPVTVVRAPSLAEREAVALPESARPPESEEAEIYQALITGLRGYVRKNGFSHVVLGLSGGIDSSMAAVLAADALGPENVWAVAMPTRYSAEASVADAREVAERIGCRFDVIPIDRTFQAFLDALEDPFEGTEFDVTEENIQARIRGVLLMALSNKFGGMVLATGNKSELAVGYATLYGDMVGGFAVMKDVFKTWVYRLAEWRNKKGEVIPRSVLEKAPSAELRPDQRDTDSLPPYEVLDPILERYVEQDRSVEEIVAAGFSREVVEEVARLVDRNEYKRRQGAPGVKITRKAFGKDRRLPITNRYRST